MDINTPVDNPALTRALADDARHDTPESRCAVTQQLMQATFLVAILTAEVQEETDGVSGQVTWQTGSHFSVLLSGDGKGGRLLPLFTDWEALRQWTDEPVSGLVMPAAEVWAFALADSLYAGAVLNPATDGLVFSPTALAQLAGQSAQAFLAG